MTKWYNICIWPIHISLLNMLYVLHVPKTSYFELKEEENEGRGDGFVAWEEDSFG